MIRFRCRLLQVYNDHVKERKGGLWMSIQKRIMMIVFTIWIPAFFTGCSDSAAHDLAVTVLEKQIPADPEMEAEYEERFVTLVRENKREKQNDPVDSWKKSYYFLAHDFMAGCFNTVWYGLNYFNTDYPPEGYRFCLKDLNDDGMPEFMLSYDFEGGYDHMWGIYEAQDNGNYYYVDSVQYFDEETGLLLDGSRDFSIYAYRFDGEKLVEEFEYYIDEQCDCEEDEVSGNHMNCYYKDKNGKLREVSEGTLKRKVNSYLDKDNVRFSGVRFTPQLLADELDIPVDSWAYECALRSYVGVLDELKSENRYSDYRYCLAEIDEDDVPELVQYRKHEINIFYYRYGRLQKASAYPDAGQDEYRFSFYPGTGVLRYEAYLDDHGTDKYFLLYREDFDTIACFTSAPVLPGVPEYRIDERTVNPETYRRIYDAMYETFGLEDDLRFEDTENYSYEDILANLESLTGAVY